MAISGTITFNPTMADCTVNAFGRIQIRADQLTAQHLRDARFEANLLCQSWANRGINLWTVDLESFSTVASTASYTATAGTISVLDVYINDDDQDLILPPVSRSDYASQPDKTVEGRPTMIWVNRQSPTPTLTLWPTPDDVYTVSYYRIRQIDDVALDSTGNPDVILRFTDAFVAGLSHRMARIWRPELEMQRKGDADQAFAEASSNDVEEGITMYITPAVGSYYP
jgi:hypothetical protein